MLHVKTNKESFPRPVSSNDNFPLLACINVNNYDTILLVYDTKKGIQYDAYERFDAIVLKCPSTSKIYKAGEYIKFINLDCLYKCDPLLEVTLSNAKGII